MMITKGQLVKNQSKSNLVSSVVNQPDQSSSNNHNQPDEIDDATLVEKCLAGDERAWEMLINRYSRLVYTVPLRFGFSQSIADEIFQETCLILLERLHTLQNPNRLSAWLVTVARRSCIQRWRRKKPVDTLDNLGAAEMVDEKIEEGIAKVEQHHLVHQAIKQLKPRCQFLINALFFEDNRLSYEEIAQELGISMGSIGPTRARCLEKLHKIMQKLEKTS